jgi:hypothetical protein
MSFAQGGLANAWGAGVYRFTPRELECFPFGPGELDPFYDELTKHVGISGVNDDLACFFGEDPDLLPPLRLSSFAAELLQAYQRRKHFFHQRGIFIGYPRLAVLTREYNGRAAYGYDSLEFFRPLNPAIYNPVFTLNELIRSGQVQYRKGYLVEGYRESDGVVMVSATELATGAREIFHARTLLLAAGSLNTAKLVLSSNGDFQTRLPILDNRMSCLPLFRLRRIGAPLDGHESTMGQLNVLCRDPDSGETLQATLYGAAGPLRSDVMFQFPLTITASLTWNKYLAPAMGVLLLFYPGKHRTGNYIKLDASGALEVKYPAERTNAAESALLGAFRKIGYLGSPRLCLRPPMGAGIHYAGSLPMKAAPGLYETYPNGRLSGSKAVYVVDGACFPTLPAKNLSFTMMANALRIATGVRRILES